jgi:hypothetical protein
MNNANRFGIGAIPLDDPHLDGYLPISGGTGQGGGYTFTPQSGGTQVVFNPGSQGFTPAGNYAGGYTGGGLVPEPQPTPIMPVTPTIQPVSLPVPTASGVGQAAVDYSGLGLAVVIIVAILLFK